MHIELPKDRLHSLKDFAKHYLKIKTTIHSTRSELRALSGRLGEALPSSNPDNPSGGQTRSSDKD